MAARENVPLELARPPRVTLLAQDLLELANSSIGIGWDDGRLGEPGGAGRVRAFRRRDCQLGTS